MKRLFVMIATGRCGSMKLESLFETVPGVLSDHDIVFGCMRKPNIWWPEIGNEYIKRKLDSFQSSEYDNIFIKGHHTGTNFIDNFLFNGIVPNAIILRRPKREIATSFYKLNCIPYRNKSVQFWYNGPDEPGVLPYNGWEAAHSYQLCYWYCLEIERRIRKYKPLLQSKGGLVWELTLDNMLDIDHFNSMLEYFGLSTVNSLSQEKVNHYEQHLPDLRIKQIPPPGEYLQLLEQQVLDNIPSEFKQYLIDNNLT